MSQPSIAIVGAGPAGLMAAEVLSEKGYTVDVFEQMPSAARKFLMAGKTGLNISHAEPLDQFISRYDASDWLKPWLNECDSVWIRTWMSSLDIDSYIGSSGRIFPIQMKAAPLLRAWLKRLTERKVQLHYRHRCIDLSSSHLIVEHVQTKQRQKLQFDAIILACGAVSWQKLGSDGRWLSWLDKQSIQPFRPSNVGVVRSWSSYMVDQFGQPLKGIRAWVECSEKAITGDIVLTQYGLESGVIYRLNREMHEIIFEKNSHHLYLDLLPTVSEESIVARLMQHKKLSLSNRWRKVGLDQAKSALLREIVARADWNDAKKMAMYIKALFIRLEDFRPIDEAISCAGGIKRTALTDDLQLHSYPTVFCCGEMLDWDAPTGGYLLTACLASGRVAAQGVDRFLS